MSFPRLKGMGTVGQRECEFLTFLLVDDFENGTLLNGLDSTAYSVMAMKSEEPSLLASSQ
jgi:hypothetical protein